MTNKKSHTPFRLMSKSTTLDDLERPIRSLLQEKMRLSEPTTEIGLTIDPYYPQQKCIGTLVSGGIRLMRIFAEVPRGGGVKRQRGCRKRQFSESLDVLKVKVKVKPIPENGKFQMAISVQWMIRSTSCLILG